MSPRGFALLLSLGVALLSAQQCTRFVHEPNAADPMLDFDWFDVFRGEVVELGPGVPMIELGPDGELGTGDDRVRPFIVGDVDLVVRSGISGFSGAIPDPRALTGGFLVPKGEAEPFGDGVPIDFVVVASDGSTSAPYGNPVSPDYFDGLPILVLAFADLDGDGFIGVTLLDGDASDFELEEAELAPVGRRFVIASGDRAAGQLFVEAGGPLGARIAIALAAAAWAGPTDPGFFSGNVPMGPAVMTHLPFIPNTDPSDILGGGPTGPPLPTNTNDLVGVEVNDALTPDPTQAYGEAFTLRLDGSDPTIDVAIMRSGAFERFGLVRAPDPQRYAALASRPLRLGQDDTGASRPYEVLRSFSVSDDGAQSLEKVRVVPQDRLGNVATLVGAELVSIRTGGTVEIVSPDSDGDPHRESVLVSGARGVEILLDDPGSSYDDANEDFLQIEGAGSLMRADLYLPDPDVDDSGLVDGADATLVGMAAAIDPGNPTFDLNGNGVVDDDDVDLATAQAGLVVPVP